MEKGESEWRKEMAAKIQKLYTAELAGHFEAEETVLFPEMERYLGCLDLVTELRREHGLLRDLINQLGPAPDLVALDKFSALLERHVRKEERRLFAQFEEKIPFGEARKVGQEIKARLIKACPRL